MSKERIEQLSIKELKINLFVRKELDPDHALKLAELIEAGVVLPPIWVARRGTVIEGRHRVEAFSLNNLETIPAIRKDIDDNDELAIIEAAYQANLGGALPPTREDTEHTVMLLLDRGATKKSIADMLKLPASLARKYISLVVSKQKRATLQRAASAVTDGGFTVHKAAEEFKVEPESLKDFLGGGKRKRKSGEDTKRLCTKLYRSQGGKVAGILRSALDRFADGECTERSVRDILDHITDLQAQGQRKVAEWRKRFDALKKEHKVAS